MTELCDMKAEAVDGESIDIARLASSARELHRLETLSADGVLREFGRFESEHPAECAGLIEAGRDWEHACRTAVDAVLLKIRHEQEGAARDAA